MEVIQIGNLWGEDTEFNNKTSGRVYDKDGICPTLNTMQGGWKQPMVIDSQIVAMRGRNPDNPSDRTVGAPTEQRLEPNSQGLCNTLTSVQKDNLVLEKEVSALRMVRTEEGKALRKQYESGEIKHAFNEHRVAEPRKDGVSNTLSTVQKDNMLLETVRIKQATSQGYIECEVGGVADLSYPDSKTRRGRVQENGQVSPTLMAGEQDICRIENQYRIRKLTPLECWRLMDFSDDDFEKAAEANSNTQLYKQAGNSIVKNVLVAIIGQMITGKESVYK